MEEKNLQLQLEQEMHEAMKQHEEVLLSTLRMLRAAISNCIIEKRGHAYRQAGRMAKTGIATPEPAGAEAGELSNEEVVAVIRSEAKKRKDAITEFTRGGRPEAAEKEAAELAILEKYLPSELSDEEIEKLVQPLAAGRALTDFGHVMGAAMKVVANRASGNRVSAIVKRMLTEQ